MLAAIGAAVYAAGAYYFAHTRFADRLAEADTGGAILRAVLVTLAAPVSVPVEYAAAVACRMRHTLAAVRAFHESGRR